MAVIDWSKVRRIVLNDRLIGYKPDAAALMKLSERVPDVQVVGFGRFGRFLNGTIWFVLAYSRYFQSEEYGDFTNLSISSVPFIKPAIPMTCIKGGIPDQS
ncbi:MAG: hypothetical protein NVS1B10_06380 [Candidatus Saccharimonadales bacterium]